MATVSGAMSFSGPEKKSAERFKKNYVKRGALAFLTPKNNSGEAVQCGADTAGLFNEMVSCVLGITAGVEKASDYTCYSFYHGDLHVPLSYIKSLRRCCSLMRKRFERFETYCLEEGCYSVANEDSGTINVGKLRQFVASAERCIAEGTGDILACIRILNMCADRCLSHAAALSRTRSGIDRRDRQDMYVQQMDYRVDILRDLSATGDLLQDVHSSLIGLQAAVRKTNAENLLCSLHETMKPLLRTFQC